MNNANQPSPLLLKAERLSKTYPDGDVAAVVDVDLEVPQGDYLAIVGTSGSGKSTLLNLLGALDRPDQGEIYFQGQPLSAIADLDAFRSQRVGFVFQSFYLLPMLTALENVQVPMFEGSRSGAERIARAKELLESVGMAHRASHLPLKLSVGERQRVAIARALANEPAMLLADEPTGNLDSVTAASIMDLFDQLHRQRGMTLILVTHDPQLAARASHVVRMRDGRLTAEADR